MVHPGEMILPPWLATLYGSGDHLAPLPCFIEAKALILQI